MGDVRAPLLPLTLEGVGYSVGGAAILDGIDLTLEAGPRTVILGPNGAGKSVLMRICHGLLAPTAGNVRWANPSAAAGPGDRRWSSSVPWCCAEARSPT